MIIARIASVLLANAAFFYLLCVGTYVSAYAFSGENITEGGLFMVSPLAFLLFSLVPFAAIAGLVNGTFINIFWKHAAVAPQSPKILGCSRPIGHPLAHPIRAHRPMA